MPIHKIIRGGEEYLPFALSQERKLRATGVPYISKAYEIGDVSISVKLEGEHSHIRIEKEEQGGYICLPRSDLHPLGVDTKGTPPVNVVATAVATLGVKDGKVNLKVKENKGVNCGSLDWKSPGGRIVTFCFGVQGRYASCEPSSYIWEKGIRVDTKKKVVGACALTHKKTGADGYLFVSREGDSSFEFYFMAKAGGALEKVGQHQLTGGGTATHPWFFNPEATAAVSIAKRQPSILSSAGWELLGRLLHANVSNTAGGLSVTVTEESTEYGSREIRDEMPATSSVTGFLPGYQIETGQDIPAEAGTYTKTSIGTAHKGNVVTEELFGADFVSGVPTPILLIYEEDGPFSALISDSTLVETITFGFIEYPDGSSILVPLSSAETRESTVKLVYRARVKSGASVLYSIEGETSTYGTSATYWDRINGTTQQNSTSRNVVTTIANVTHLDARDQSAAAIELKRSGAAILFDDSPTFTVAFTAKYGAAEFSKTLGSVTFPHQGGLIYKTELNITQSNAGASRKKGEVMFSGSARFITPYSGRPQAAGVVVVGKEINGVVTLKETTSSFSIFGEPNFSAEPIYIF